MYADLVIVGAGPHGLAMALRWLQGSVGNFTDHEHTVQSYIRNKEKKKSENKRERMIVVDPAGEWMAKWNSSFDALEITYLRSTMFMHPDPFDLYSFLAFAHENNLQSELVPITELYCEHEVPVSERKRKKKENRQYKGFSLFPENRRELFFRPSQNLFKKFCESLIHNNQLDDVVIRGSVVTTDVMPNGKVRVTLDSQQEIEAKYVVFATGFSQPLFPEWFPTVKAQVPDRILHSGEWCIKQLKNNIKKNKNNNNDNSIQQSIKNEKTKKEKEINVELHKGEKNVEMKGKRVLVVGGGLTSAHLVLAAVNQGCEKVVLVSRKFLVTKLFDLDLAWMGTCRNLQYSKFWNAHKFEDRIRTIKEARGGGSITFEIRRQLANFEEQGLVEIRENCEIENVEVVETNSMKVTFKNCGNSEHFDFLWVATGSKIDILAEPYLQSYLQSNSIETKCGFPVLDQNLKLHPKHNIFVMGGYSSLQLGPDARNLSGCRNAADRICAFIENSQNSRKLSENSRKLRENLDTKNTSNSQKVKDGKWANFGNEDFNAFSLLAEDCGI